MFDTSKNDIGQGLRIPLADDNQDASSSMAELPIWCGHEVGTPGNGMNALKPAVHPS